MSDIIAKDTSIIPKGMYCYKSIGFEGDNYLVAHCPYFFCTGHGTILCKFLDAESLSPEAGEGGDLDRELAYKYFGSKEKAWEATVNGGLLWDSVKECGINCEEDDYCED